jgi:ubiquinone biosynthesis protein
VRVFYTQVFRDNFFHADRTPGNIWVISTRARPTRSSSRSISGSWASCRRQDQRYLAENFMAMFNRDYRRIAELHVQAGWMPGAHPHRRPGSGGARGVRALLHPPALRDLAGEVLLKLFRTAQPTSSPSSRS